MSIPISDFDGSVVAPNADYPNGNIKDRVAGVSGTRANAKSNSDIFQFFQKLMIDAGLTANGQFDNATNGYQYVQALLLKIESVTDPIASNVSTNTADIATNTSSITALNTQVGLNTSDIITLFSAISGINTIPAWSNATYATSWAAGGSPVKYTKDSAGRVYMQGFAVTTGTPGAATVLTLPVGYRPTSTINLLLPSSISLSSTAAYISINTSGVVSLQNFGSYVLGSTLYFDSVLFLTI